METRRFSLRNLGRSLRDRPLPFRYLPLNRSDNLNIRLKNPRKYLWIATTIVLTFVALFSVFKITSPTRLKQNLQIVASAAVTARLFDNVPPTLWPMRWPDSRFAYAMYATNQQYLCNTLINFHQLNAMKVSGERALIYPEEWDRLHPVGSEHTIRKMLDKAVKEYNVNLHPMSMWSTNRGDPTWSNSLTKLHIFALTDYKRVIYFDSDGIVLNNLDHLFLAPEARIALPRAYWLEPGKLASHIMVVMPEKVIMDRVKDWVEHGGNAVGFDMEVMNTLFSNSSLILPHRGYAMLTGEFRNKDHSRYLADDITPNPRWNPHEELSKAYYIHFSDWPLPKPWIKASEFQIKQVQPDCVPGEMFECANRQHWSNIYDLYDMLSERACKI